MQMMSCKKQLKAMRYELGNMKILTNKKYKELLDKVNNSISYKELINTLENQDKNKPCTWSISRWVGFKDEFIILYLKDFNKLVNKFKSEVE